MVLNNKNTPEVHYKFTKRDDQILYKPDPVLFKYYQLCNFENKNKLFFVRRFLCNEDYAILEVKEAEFTKRQIDEFINKAPQNSYKIFSVYNFKHTHYPTTNDLIMAHSTLIRGTVTPTKIREYIR